MTPLKHATTILWNELVQSPAADESLDIRCQRAARAMLAAMREPSDTMVRLGMQAQCADPERNAADVWKVMIDAALDDEPTSTSPRASLAEVID